MRGWRLPMAVAGALLAGDGIALMVLVRGFNFGILLPGLLGIALLALAWRWHAVARWRATQPWRQWLWRLGWASLVVWAASVALFFQFIRSSIDELAPKSSEAPQAILILGSGTSNCKVSPTLAARLDEGLRQAQAMPEAAVVVSGGPNFGGMPCTEARVMADYLEARGLPPNRLVHEERATSTAENMVFSHQLLVQQGGRMPDSVLVVTSDFHLMRAERIARKAGFAVVFGAAALTPLYIRYNAWLREYFAYISGWLLNEY